MGGIAPGIIETTDAAADASTAYTLGIGQTARANISSGGDHDRFKVNLVAGQTYTFAMVGTGSASLTDTYLRLLDLDGTTVLSVNDNGLQNTNSIISYTATTTGTFYLDAAAFRSTATGQYGVSATLGTKASFDSDMIAGILDTHASWSGTRGTGVTITYGFRDTYSGTETNFSHVGAVQQAAIKTVLQYYSEITGITFQQVNPGGYTDNATMLFSDYAANDGAGAYAYYPGSTASTSVAGDVWLNDGSVSKTSLPMGSYAMYTLMHEIGHALGLSHPGMYNAGNGVSISYANSAQFVQDSTQYTNMSYWGGSNTGASMGGYADTPMLYDILALQLKYGANMTTRTGDTVYGFGSNAGDVYDFAINNTPSICIWDAGGNDTLNTSRFFQNQTISLNAGDYSNIGGLVNNVSIAFGATIENAIGGQGNDCITGNQADNILTGGNGCDMLQGGAGNDTLYGDGAGTRKGAQISLAHLNQTYTGGGWGDATLQRTGFAIPATALTFEMLLRMDAPPSYASRIISYGDNSWDGYGGQDFTLRADLYQSNFEVVVGGQSFDTGLSLSTFVGSDAARLSITWNKTDGSIGIYLNGQLYKSGFVGAGTVLPANATLDIMDGSFQVIKGSIGDIRVWNQVRTAAQIDAAAWTTLDTPATQTGLVANWQLNTSAGAGVFTDASGHLGNLVPVSVAAGNTPTAETVDFSRFFNDALFGGDGNDTLTGGVGNDSLDGGAGSDSLSGGDGDDIITFDVADFIVDGGLGYDTGIYQGASAAQARVFDMVAHGIDKLQWVLNSNTYTMTANADGSRTESVIDTAGTEASFASRTARICADGTVDWINSVTDDGLRMYNDYDNLGNQTWTQMFQKYNAAGVTDYRDYRYDDGTRTIFDDDDQNNQIWTQLQQRFDTQGREDYRDYRLDTGGRQIVDYDQAGNQAWTQVIQIYDSQGREDYRDYRMDNGTRQLTDYDQAGDKSWTQCLQIYDASGREDYRDYRLDTGVRQIVDYDQADNQAWTQVNQVYDVQGREDYRDYRMDDGTRQLTDYDQAGDKSWIQCAQVYDALGREDYRDYRMDDGSRLVVDYDQAGTNAWASWQREYHTVGDATPFRQIVTYDDGHIVTL